MSLDVLRNALAGVDTDLVTLAAKRVRIARDIALAKMDEGLPTIDFLQERRVLDRARQAALQEGLDPRVAESLIATLIEANVARQEEHRVALAGSGSGRIAVVVGGAGRMGRWCMGFLALHGYHVHCLDPAEPTMVPSGTERLADADLILLAAPPTVIADIYTSWLDKPPRGTIADVASIKAPLVPALRELQQAGATVGSFHPLFGPGTTSLRGAHVVVCDTGDPVAEATLNELFTATCAHIHRMDLDAHDRRMADILARSHAVALAFAASDPRATDGLHSSTEARLAAIAAEVTQESAGVYYEIQALNPYAPAAVARVRRSLKELQDLVAIGPDGFKEWMRSARPEAPCG